MNKKSFTKRILAVTLSIIMVLGLMPMTAVASDVFPGKPDGMTVSGSAIEEINGQTVWLCPNSGGNIVKNNTENGYVIYEAVPYGGYTFSHWATYCVAADFWNTFESENRYDEEEGYTFSKPDSKLTRYNEKDSQIRVNISNESNYTYYVYAVFVQGISVSISVEGGGAIINASNLDNYNSSIGQYEYYVQNAGGTVHFGAGKNSNMQVQILSDWATYYEHVYVNDVDMINSSYVYYSDYGSDRRHFYVQTFTVTEPITIRAVTKQRGVNIIFYSNDVNATGTMEERFLQIYEDYDLPENQFVNEGYIFSGWNTKADGTGTSYTDKQSVRFTIADDGTELSLYAQWTKCNDHTWTNGECSKCGAICSHTGGNATCTEKATCTTCGEKYGELRKHYVSYTASLNRIVETCTVCNTHTATADIVRDENVSTVYNGSAIEALKVNYSDNWQSNDLDIVYSNNINAGIASGTISIGGATATQTFEITAAIMIGLSARGCSGTYDGQAHGITVNAPQGATVSYKVGDGEYSTENPTFKDVGTYAVTYKVSMTNYADVIGTAEVNIAKASLTVTANDHSIKYGEEPANNGVIFSGFVSNENADVLGGTLAYSHTYSQYGNVGNYDITVSGLTSDNYEITYVKGTLTVEQKEIGIAWSNTALTYNGAAQKPTATATGVVNGDQIVLTVDGSETNASDTAYTATVTGISGEKAGNYKLSSNVSTSFTIAKADQAAPTELSKTDETISKKADGTISGITGNMEYRKDGETTYESVNGSVLENLAAGKYHVRVKGDSNHNPSPETAITIDAGRKLMITVPQNQVGYTLTSDVYEVDYLGNATLTFTLKEGYTKGENFKIVLNGNPDAEWNNGQLPLSIISTDVNIVVEGVVDISVPVAEIDVKGNKWTEFWNNITFGLFFKETQDVTITATDKGSGVKSIEYYLAGGELELDEVLSIKEWVEYNGAFKINPNNRYVVYAKIVDNAGNTVYVNSDGIVLDDVAPTLEGIENGKTYYGDLTVIKSDEQFYDIKIVTLDGEPMGFAEGTYGLIPADNAEHTVVVEDHAGNKTTYTVTVMKNYTVTYRADGEIVSTETVGHGKDATLPAVPAKAGYTGKWDHDGKNITSDIVINAVYTENSASASPQTGDNSNMFLWITLLFISGGAIITLTVVDRKRRTVNKR